MRKFRMLLLLLVMMLLAAPFCYGSEQSFGDGQVKVDFPGSWRVVDEADRKDVLRVVCSGTEEEVSQYMDYYHSLLMAEDPSADPKAMIQILYSTDYGDDDQMDFSDCTEEELEVFYRDQDGKEVLDNAALFLTFGLTDSTDEAEVVLTDWGKFLHTQMKESMKDGSQLYHQMYYTMKGSAVITLSLTTSGPPSEQSVKDMEKVVSSFSDSGWYDDYILDSEAVDGYEDDYEENDVGWIGFAIPVIVLTIVAMTVAAQKKAKGGKTGYDRKRPAGVGQERERMTASENTAYSASEKKKHTGIKIPKTKSVKADGKAIQVRDSGPAKAKTPDESYLESLRTLMASGLLTKEEYRDMVDAHNRNKRI